MEAPPDYSIPTVPAPEPVPEPLSKQEKRRFTGKMIVAILLIGLIAGSFIGYAISYSDFNEKLSHVESQLQGYPQSPVSTSYPNETYLVSGNVSLSDLYSQVRSSVVVIQDLVPEYNLFGILAGYSLQQGSGFITTSDNEQVIVTNDHVVQNSINVTVTFANGASYPATVLGSDSLADLAVITVTPMPSDLTSLVLVSSQSLQVGQPVVAVGTPYGLSGTLTTGVVSALGRTITESSSNSPGSNGPTIPDIIQTSTAINPGNSGGPMLNYNGEVVGITTAAVSSSQGLGFAIPSDTISRELPSLITTSTYNDHPTIDATLTDMTFQIAQAMGTTVTYGSLVETVTVTNGLKGGTTSVSILGTPVTIGGDIIIAINGVRITSTDDLLSYLEDHTLPGQSANFTVVRNGQTQVITVTIEKQS